MQGEREAGKGMDERPGSAQRCVFVFIHSLTTINAQ
jgi:hypothetical protein